MCMYLKDKTVLGLNFTWDTLYGVAYCTVNSITMQIHTVTREGTYGIAGNTVLVLRS